MICFSQVREGLCAPDLPARESHSWGPERAMGQDLRNPGFSPELWAVFQDWVTLGSGDLPRMTRPHL